MFDPVLVGRRTPGGPGSCADTRNRLLALLPGCCVPFFPGKKHQQRGAVTGVAHSREHWAGTGRLHQASGQHGVKDAEAARETRLRQCPSIPNPALARLHSC